MGDVGIPIELTLSGVGPKLVVVPDVLREAIDAKLDAAIAAIPDAAKDREILYSQLLAFFDEYGYLPDFTITERT